MKPLQMNLTIIIKKYLCSLHEYFLGVESPYNDFMLGEMIMYICSYNLNTISFDFYIGF